MLILILGTFGLLAPAALAPQVACWDDVHEPNAERRRAARVAGGAVSGLICASDVDWFVVELRPGVYEVHLGGQGATRLAWFRPRRRRPAFGLRVNGARTLRVRRTGRHRFVVRGASATPYVVRWRRR